MDSVFSLLAHITSIGLITVAFQILKTIFLVIAMVIMNPFRQRDGVVETGMLVSAGSAMYVYVSLVALATISYLGDSEGFLWKSGIIVISLLAIIVGIGRDIYERNKKARESGFAGGMGTEHLEPFLIAPALLIFLAMIFIPVLAVPFILNPVLNVINWIIGLPIISTLALLVGFGFTLYVIFYGIFLVVMTIAMVARRAEYNHE